VTGRALGALLVLAGGAVVIAEGWAHRPAATRRLPLADRGALVGGPEILGADEAARRWSRLMPPGAAGA
jgi:hypothetical protein